MSVAAIDIGTNSVRLLILDETGKQVAREMEITRLGQGVDRTGVLSDVAMERTVIVLQRYAELLNRHRAKDLRMTTTSAARDASNRDEFYTRVRAAVGQDPELLSGEDEAKLSFAGATASLPASPSGFIVFDIGGGSTEFARGVSEPERFLSLDIGAVRVTERYLNSDPPTADQLALARRDVSALLEEARKRLEPQGNESWVGLAGTVTTFAAHAAQTKRYAPELTHGKRLSRQLVDDFTTTLAAIPSSQRATMLMEPKRAPVIVGGALVLQSIMHDFELDSITTSEHDILDGLAASLLI
jgi:exopolyphosphatase/guanosine-5'-triphosphate,3'-diphosphate pyrophosphatase